MRRLIAWLLIFGFMLSSGWVLADDGASILTQKAARSERPHVKSIKELEKQAIKQKKAALKKKKKMEKEAKRRNAKIKEAMEEQGGRP